VYGNWNHYQTLRSPSRPSNKAQRFRSCAQISVSYQLAADAYHNIDKNNLPKSPFLSKLQTTYNSINISPTLPLHQPTSTFHSSIYLLLLVVQASATLHTMPFLPSSSPSFASFDLPHLATTFTTLPVNVPFFPLINSAFP
jgi:hypothetical protein